MPIACAPSRCAICPMRLRSRPHTCISGSMPYRFEEERAERQVRHAGRGARAVGHVDDVDARVDEHLRRVERARRVEAGGGVHLDGDDEFPCRELLRELAPLRERHRIERLHRGGRRLHVRRFVCSTARPGEHAHRVRHPPDVIRRRAAAAADHLPRRAGSCGARRRRSTPAWPCRAGARRRCAGARRSAGRTAGGRRRACARPSRARAAVRRRS
jgi:hypothetical protein